MSIFCGLRLYVGQATPPAGPVGEDAAPTEKTLPRSPAMGGIPGEVLGEAYSVKGDGSIFHVNKIEPSPFCSTDFFHLFSADKFIINDKDSHAIPLKITWVLLIMLLEVLLNIALQRLKFPLKAIHNLTCATEFIAFSFVLKLKGDS